MLYFGHPLIYHSTYDLPQGSGNSALWRGNVMHSTTQKCRCFFFIFYGVSSDPATLAGCTALFLIWQIILRCRVETLVRNGTSPRCAEHLLCGHRIHRTHGSNTSQRATEGEEAVQQTHKALTVGPRHRHGNCMFDCANQT